MPIQYYYPHYRLYGNALFSIEPNISEHPCRNDWHELWFLFVCRYLVSSGHARFLCFCVAKIIKTSPESSPPPDQIWEIRLSMSRLAGMHHVPVWFTGEVQTVPLWPTCGKKTSHKYLSTDSCCCCSNFHCRFVLVAGSLIGDYIQAHCF